MRTKPWKLTNLLETNSKSPASSFQVSDDSSRIEDLDASITLPSLSNVERLWNSVREEAFLKGYQEGVEEGRRAGRELGIPEGQKEGRTEGYKEGYQAGFSEATNKLSAIGDALKSSLSEINMIPQMIKEDLVDLAYEIAMRLGSSTTLDKGAVERAVSEVFGQLPRSLQDFTVRVPMQDVAAWEAVLSSWENSPKPSVLGDSTLGSGAAFVEVGGVCLDIGIEARRALVRNALGLSLNHYPTR